MDSTLLPALIALLGLILGSFANVVPSASAVAVGAVQTRIESPSGG